MWVRRSPLGTLPKRGVEFRKTYPRGDQRRASGPRALRFFPALLRSTCLRGGGGRGRPWAEGTLPRALCQERAPAGVPARSGTGFPDSSHPLVSEGPPCWLPAPTASGPARGVGRPGEARPAERPGEGGGLWGKGSDSQVGFCPSGLHSAATSEARPGLSLGPHAAPPSLDQIFPQKSINLLIRKLDVKFRFFLKKPKNMLSIYLMLGS